MKLIEAVVTPVPNPPPANPASAPTASPANPPVRGNPLSSARTSAANFGKRVGLAALSALGSRSAQGRLSIQAITNELVTRFIQFAKGRNISDADMTDDYVYQFIEKYYGPDAVKAAGGTPSGGGGQGTSGQGNTPPTNPPGGPAGVLYNAPNVSSGQTNYPAPASNAQPQAAAPPTPAGQPVSTPQTAPAPAPPAQPPTRPRRRVQARSRKIKSYDPWWIMATLNTVLQSAQRGTSRLDEVCTTIRAIQRDPQANDRFPQLNQIASESHDRLFDLMVYLVENQIKEKPDLLRACQQFLPEAFVTRADIWQIFRNLADWMNREGLASTTRKDRKGQERVVGFNANNPQYGGGIGGNARFAGQTQTGAQQQQSGTTSQQGQQGAAGSNLGSMVITQDVLNRASQEAGNLSISQQRWDYLSSVVGQNGESLDTIFSKYGGQPPTDIAALLLYALKNTP